MSLRRVSALALRIIRQFLRDRRSLALIFLAPLLIMTLLNFVLNNSTSGVTLGVVPPQGQTGAGYPQRDPLATRLCWRRQRRHRLARRRRRDPPQRRR